MSKISMPRPRYVAFVIASGVPVSRRAIGNALRARARADGWADADAPALTRYAYPHGIVRVEHIHALRARELIPRIEWVVEGDAKITVALTSLATSGTLLALTEAVGVLKKRTDG